MAAVVVVVVLPQRKFKDAKSMVPQLTKAQLALPCTQSEKCCQAAGCTASSARHVCLLATFRWQLAAFGVSVHMLDCSDYN